MSMIIIALVTGAVLGAGGCLAIILQAEWRASVAEQEADDLAANAEMWRNLAQEWREQSDKWKAEALNQSLPLPPEPDPSERWKN
jgi:hypothetical protein